MRTLHLVGVPGISLKTVHRDLLEGGFLYAEITVDARRHEARKQAVGGLVIVNSDGLFPCLVILINVNLGEENLIEEPPGTVFCFQVGGVAVSG